MAGIALLPGLPAIRQVVICARDYDKACGELANVFGTFVCHKDPGLAYFGLQNALLPMGQ